MPPVGFLTSASLIETVKRESMLPASQSTFNASDFLAIANQEMRVGLVPSILQYHQEYYVRDSDPVTIVANQNNYAIPYRAVGGKIRDVFYLDESHNVKALTRIFPDQRPYFQQSNFQNRFLYFYLQGNEVVLMPDVGPNPVGSLVFSFYMRPNELVDEARVATIQSIATTDTTTTYTVDAIPSGMSTSTPLDLMQTKPGHRTYSFDQTPLVVNLSDNTIVFNTSQVRTPAISPNVGTVPVVGDYIAFAGECIIPQAPSDLHDLLSQRVVARCLQALGDQAGYQMAMSKVAEMEKWSATLLDNRTEGEPSKVNSLNSPLRIAKMRRRGW